MVYKISSIFFDKDNRKALIIFFVAFILRLLYTSLTYGGGDVSNGVSFYDFYASNFDIYSSPSPWPYFPFANSILLLWEKLSLTLDIDLNLAYRITSIFFDSLISVQIFNYLNLKKSEWAFRYGLGYSLNPVTIIIFSFLGFTDSLAMFFLIYAVIVSEFEEHKTKEIYSSLLFAISISIKPIALIFLPFFFIKTNKKLSWSVAFFISFLVLNSYYLIANPLGSLELVSYIFGKFSSGHQSSLLGLGSLEPVLGLNMVKFFSLIGLLIFLIFYLFQLKKDYFIFILTMFSITLAFRYNLHPQYLTWLIPFAFLLERQIIFLLTVSTFSLISLLTHWSTSGITLFNNGEETTSTFLQILTYVHQNKISSILLGLFLIISILSLIEAQQIFDIKKLSQRVFKKITFVKISDVIKIVMITLLMSFIFFIFISDKVEIRFGILARIFLLFSLPFFIFLYLTFAKIIKEKLFFYLNFFVLLLVIFFSYYFSNYLSSFLLTYFLTVIIIIFFHKRKFKFLSEIYTNDRVQINKKITPKFFIPSSLIICISILAIGTWQDLYSSSKNKFTFYKGIGFYKEISVQKPERAFEYGRVYKFEANFSEIRDFDKVFISLVSDSYHKVIINNKDIGTSYSPIYFLRHPTKMKSHKFGLRTIDISKHWIKGNNNIQVITNNASLKKSIGLYGKLLFKGDVNKQFDVDLSSISWKVHQGSFSHNIFNPNHLLEFKIISLEDLDESYDVKKHEIKEMFQNNSKFIVPIKKEDLPIIDRTSILIVSIFVLLFISSLLINKRYIFLIQKES